MATGHLVVAGLGKAAGLAARMARVPGIGLLAVETRRFPDGECYARWLQSPGGARLWLVGQFAPPDAGLLEALIAADAAREQGAGFVGLVAPYLPYLRQDRQFKPGEAVSSRTVAAVLSRHFDGLVTVDPHLHRYKSLSEIYSIPSRVLHAVGPLAGWITARTSNPVLIGPDSESRQWVSRVAALCKAPFTVMRKKRVSSVEVHSSGLRAADVRGREAVVLDDIISSGHTMAGVVEAALHLGARKAFAVGVHGLFAPGARKLLKQAGAAAVVTCNTVPGPTAKVDVSELLAEAVLQDQARAATGRRARAGCTT